MACTFHYYCILIKCKCVNKLLTSFFFFSIISTNLSVLMDKTLMDKTDLKKLPVCNLSLLLQKKEKGAYNFVCKIFASLQISVSVIPYDINGNSCQIYFYYNYFSFKCPYLLSKFISSQLINYVGNMLVFTSNLHIYNSLDNY